jgi:hypothetical protein
LTDVRQYVCLGVERAGAIARALILGRPMGVRWARE